MSNFFLSVFINILDTLNYYNAINTQTIIFFYCEIVIKWKKDMARNFLFSASAYNSRHIGRGRNKIRVKKIASLLSPRILGQYIKTMDSVIKQTDWQPATPASISGRASLVLSRAGVVCRVPDAPNRKSATNRKKTRRCLYSYLRGSR